MDDDEDRFIPVAELDAQQWLVKMENAHTANGLLDRLLCAVRHHQTDECEDFCVGMEAFELLDYIAEAGNPYATRMVLATAVSRMVRMEREQGAGND